MVWIPPLHRISKLQRVSHKGKEQKGYLNVGVSAAHVALQLHVGKVDIYFLSFGLCDEIDTLSVVTEGSRQGRKQELTLCACVVPATAQIRWGEQRREGMVIGMAFLWLDTSGSIFKTLAHSYA